jgi:hypothetical protein
MSSRVNRILRNAAQRAQEAQRAAGIAKDYFGLSVPMLQALQINVVPCMCGHCSGMGVQFEARLHLTPQGPVLIRRLDEGPNVEDVEPPTPPGSKLIDDHLDKLRLVPDPTAATGEETA